MPEQPIVVIVRLPGELARELDRRRNAEPDVPSRGEYITRLITEALDGKTLLAHLVCSEQLHVCDLGISAQHRLLRRTPTTKLTLRKIRDTAVGEMARSSAATPRCVRK